MLRLRNRGTSIGSIASLTKLGRGGEGTVYKVSVAGESLAVKIYHNPSQEKSEKLAAMLGYVPKDSSVSLNALRFVQLAWPTDLVEDSGQVVGFAMPYVETSHSDTLDFYLDPTLTVELPDHERLTLPTRLEIARNLAAVVGLLHDSGSFFIDFKPQNIRVYRRYHTVSFIDCDGFSVTADDGRRYNATSYSSEYICPEALKGNLRPDQLGIEQDLYALAVVVFQLLNFGIHPFSGISAKLVNAPTTDDKVAMGLYGYGRLPNPMITPHNSSIHNLLSPALRDAFDRAFSVPARYPKSSEWVTLIDSILTGKELSRCTRYPQDPTHIHFDKQDCIACKRNELLSDKRKRTSTASWAQPATLSSGNPTPSNGVKKDTGFVIMMVAIAAILAIAFLNSSHDSKPTPTSTQSPAPTVASAPSPSPSEGTEREGNSKPKGFNLGAYRYLCNANTLEELSLTFSGTKGNYEVETPYRRYSVKEVRFKDDGTFFIKAIFANDPDNGIELAGEKTGDDSFRLSRYIWRDGANKTVGVVLNGHVVKTDFRSVELSNCTE